MKNSLEGFKFIFEQAKERTSKPEYRTIKAVDKRGIERKRLKESEQSPRDQWDTTKETNIYIVEVSEKEEREKDVEKVCEEIMTENFSNLMKHMNINIQEAQ